MHQRDNFTISRFMCTNCGKETIPLPRPKDKQREWSHLKKLYCPYCDGEHNAFEIKNDYEKEIFKILFEEEYFKDPEKFLELDKRKRQLLKDFKRGRL